MRYARTKETALATWIMKLMECKPARLATIALANKTARIALTILARGGEYWLTAIPAAGLLFRLASTRLGRGQRSA